MRADEPAPGRDLRRVLGLVPRALLRQFAVYTLVGAIATGVDWGSFYCFLTLLGLDYRIAVSLSFLLGATANYTLNRWITFQDKTRQIVAQVGVYTAVSLASLVMSVALMTAEVELLKMAPMPARILTTGIMLFANYLMHKFMTFNPRLYRGLGRRAPSRGVVGAEEER